MPEHFPSSEEALREVQDGFAKKVREELGERAFLEERPQVVLYRTRVGTYDLNFYLSEPHMVGDLKFRIHFPGPLERESDDAYENATEDELLGQAILLYGQSEEAEQKFDRYVRERKAGVARMVRSR